MWVQQAARNSPTNHFLQILYLSTNFFWLLLWSFNEAKISTFVRLNHLPLPYHLPLPLHTTSQVLHFRTPAISKGAYRILQKFGKGAPSINGSVMSGKGNIVSKRTNECGIIFLLKEHKYFRSSKKHMHVIEPEPCHIYIHLHAINSKWVQTAAIVSWVQLDITTRQEKILQKGQRVELAEGKNPLKKKGNCCNYAVLTCDHWTQQQTGQHFGRQPHT